MVSARKREDDRLLGLIKHHWLASGGVYGYRKVTMDLRESGETCSRHRVLRLMRTEGLRAEVGYGSKPRFRGGPVGVVAKRTESGVRARCAEQGLGDRHHLQYAQPA